MSWRAPTGQRRGAIDWIELIFKDHGFLRVAWHNQHQIADGVWRSNQPGPSRIAKLADQGIKTNSGAMTKINANTRNTIRTAPHPRATNVKPEPKLGLQMIVLILK